MKEALSRLKGLKLKLFRMSLGWAQGLAPLREDGIANVGYGYPVLREMLFEIGKRLEDHPSIDLPAKNDLFPRVALINGGEYQVIAALLERPDEDGSVLRPAEGQELHEEAFVEGLRNAVLRRALLAEVGLLGRGAAARRRGAGVCCGMLGM